MKQLEAIQLINDLAKKKQSFFTLIDFEAQNYQVFDSNQIKNQEILFAFPETRNCEVSSKQKTALKLSFQKPDLNQYSDKFNLIKKELDFGNSYLCNLTCPVEVKTSASLLDIFNISDAKYKIHYPELFTCFSPETFIQIKDQIITTYPMKGTEADPLSLLENQKEVAEHATIVDLLRNDLSTVAQNVLVSNYRYLDQIRSHQNQTFFQSSSEIQGDLEDAQLENLGSTISALLPAGSVTGAPKKETLRIIKEVEQYDRGFYTGIAGYFDGKTFDSCVMIRFIEQKEEKLYFKAGGGITSESILESEYQELIDKIYVPISRNN